MSEEWRGVVGYEGRYEVSNEGQVRSLPRTAVRSNGTSLTVRGRVLSPSARNSGGYPLVNLSNGNGKQQPRYVHHLVADAFIGRRPDGLEVCHRDGNPRNNRSDNLRYGTSRENSLDMVSHYRNNVAKTHCPQGHPYSGANLYRNPTGRRICVTCRNDSARRYRARKAAV